MQPALQQEKLCTAVWHFGELGHPPWATGFAFLPDGRIGGYQNPHESRWQIIDGRLEILSADGALTWRFIVTGESEGLLALEGTFLLDDSFKGIGSLREVAVPAPAADGPAETLAVLVVGYAAPKILDRLAAFFEGEKVRLFAHIDAKKELSKYVEGMVHAGKINFIEERVPVFWGGFSMVAAELALIRAALADPAVANVVLISDDTAPLLPAAEIYQALREAPDRIASTSNGWREGWYRGFFYPDCHYGSLRDNVMHEARQFTPADFAMVTRLEALRARGKKPIKTVHFCRQWWALSREKLETLMQFVDADEQYVESFRFSLFSDETFFPTAFKLCFPDETPLEVPTYTDFATVPRHPNPWIYQTAAEVISAKLPEGSLFIRKLAPEKPEIFDQLVQSWVVPDPLRQATQVELPAARASHAAFLHSSEIRVTIEHNVEAHFDDALALTAFAGQMNFTKRLSLDDAEEAREALRHLLNQSNIVAGLVHVRDRFGDYGFTGIYVMSIGESQTRLEHFCFSDRITGMGVERWLFERLGRPELTVVGDVLTDLFAEDAPPDWINAQTGGEAAQERLAGRILLRGGCAMGSTSHYLTLNADEVVGEFNIVHGGKHARRDHSVFLRYALEGMTEAQRAAAMRIGYAPEDFESALATDPGAFDVCVFSFMNDARFALYKHPASGLRVPFFELFEDPAANLLPMKLIDVKAFREAPEILELVRGMRNENYQFESVSTQIFNDDLTAILARIPEHVTLILLLDPEDYTDTNGATHVLHHFIKFNDVMREVTAGRPNVHLLNVLDFVEQPGERINADHFNRMVYFRFYQKIAAILRARSVPAPRAALAGAA